MSYLASRLIGPFVAGEDLERADLVVLQADGETVVRATSWGQDIIGAAWAPTRKGERLKVAQKVTVAP